MVIQSMTNTKTNDIRATSAQIEALVAAGCELVRVSIPDNESLAALPALIEAATVPLIADIHFQAELAVKSIEAGVAKIRINPGNIGARDRVASVVRAAKEAGVPIRVGVNSGSLSKAVRALDVPPAEKLVASALENVRLLEELGFEDIVVSVKSSDVTETIEAYRSLARQVDYPLHLGVTESGTRETGALRTAVALGALLADGIGDTIRVSLAADPVEEIDVAKQILQAVGARRFYPEVIACPTCARCEIDLFPLARELEDRLKKSGKLLKVAVMGCVVNGPGEAADADVGLAAGRGKGVIFREGEAIKTVPEREFLAALMEAVDEI